MDRKETLMTAESMVNGDRQQDYGTPEDNFKTIGDFWEVYVNKHCIVGSTGHVFFTPHDVAMMLSLMKHGRIATGAKKADNYVDACGYLACASEIATEVKPKSIPLTNWRECIDFETESEFSGITLKE